MRRSLITGCAAALLAATSAYAALEPGSGQSSKAAISPQLLLAQTGGGGTGGGGTGGSGGTGTGGVGTGTGTGTGTGIETGADTGTGTAGATTAPGQGNQGTINPPASQGLPSGSQGNPLLNPGVQSPNPADGQPSR